MPSPMPRRSPTRSDTRMREEMGETMGNTAILYSTGITKNTKKIADYVAGKLDADTFNLKEINMLDLSAYDTIIFGTGIHAGNPYKPVVSFIENNGAQLSNKKVKLFISCMYSDEKGSNQCLAVADRLGISDAVYFCKKGDSLNSAGVPSKVDTWLQGF